MSVAAFLSELRRRDIRVWVEGDRLRCDARAGALTEAMREELRGRKEAIVGFLRLAGEAAAQPRGVVPMQPRGERAPIFAIPPHTGDVFAYRALALALGEAQPFFALQPPGADGAGEPLASVEGLAAHFAAQLLACRPRGPWIVAGYCMGGTLAFELARQLAGAGKPPACLVLLGAPHPAFFGRASQLRHQLGNRARGWRRRLALLAAQSGRERLAYVAWRLALSRRPADRVLAARARLEQATLAAVRAYRPRPYGGPVQHYLPCERWARRSGSQALRWASLAPRVETFFGPEGCTADDMLLGGHAAIFAEQLRRGCARALA